MLIQYYRHTIIKGNLPFDLTINLWHDHGLPLEETADESDGFAKHC